MNSEDKKPNPVTSPLATTYKRYEDMSPEERLEEERRDIEATKARDEAEGRNWTSVIAIGLPPKKEE
jgi:hypothetical protein